jgi:hypothetical protein
MKPTNNETIKQSNTQTSAHNQTIKSANKQTHQLALQSLVDNPN